MLGEKELHTLLIQNPEKGLEKIMDEYLGFVYSIVYGKLSAVSNRQDIEECVSDVFYEVFKTRNYIDLDKGTVKTYLAVLAKRRAIDIFRKLVGDADNVHLNEYDHEWIASDTDIEKSVIATEKSDLLIKEIKALGEPDSQIIIRKYYFGQTSRTISKSLGIKENTVNKKVGRALEKLKKTLEGVL